jgi:CubicO group peptidase (beta-lactamase class C family)
VQSTQYDAIVVGSGISGGWAAKELTEKGLRVLMLERGRNIEHIKDYVNATLRSWRLPASAHTATTPVTLRALLSHTAGLTVHGFPGYDVDSARPTLPQVLDGAPPANTAPVRSDTTPGARWKYSGGGISVAQQMVVDVTGRPFPAYMRDAVLAPLGMARSSYEQPPPPALAARTAAGHSASAATRASTGSP